MAMTATRFCASDINTSHTAQVSIWPGVGENYGEGTLPKRIENGNKLLQADAVNLPVPPDLRRGLASAKHWYSGRIDRGKNHSVLSKIGRGVARSPAVSKNCADWDDAELLS